MVWEYFQKFYIAMDLSYSMPLTEGVRILCMVVLFNNFENKPKYYLRTVIHFLLFWVLEILVKALFYNFSWGMTYPALIMLAIYALFFGNIKFKYRLYYALYYFVLVHFSTSFVKSIGAVICNMANVEYEVWAANLCLAIGRAVLYVGFTLLIKIFPQEKFDDIAKYDFVSISVLAALTWIAFEIVDNIKDFFDGVLNPTETEQSLFIFAIGALIYLMLAILYHSSYAKAEERSRNKRLEMQVDEMKEQYETHSKMMELSRENLEEMCKIRHDIRNQFSYMQLIFEQDKYNELKKYFNELNDKVAFPLSFSDCENRVVRDVLNMEINKLKNGTKIDYSVAVGNEMKIDDLDLTTVLINLLDNAIEACERDKIEDAVISFSMREEGSYLYIGVSNPVADGGKAKKQFEEGTVKTDKRSHGLGKKIVAEIVEKHDGVIKYEINDRFFRVNVMLALSQ